MKKFTAILVTTAVLCSFTACELDTAYNVTDEKKISVTVLANGTYREAIQTFLDCMNNHDVEGIMKMSYPDKYVDTMYFVKESSGESIEEKMNNLSEELPETVRLTKIISEETLGDDEKEEFYVYYLAMQLMDDYIEENVQKNIDLEKDIDIEKFLDTKPYCKLNDLCIVDCVLEYENENGGTFTAEQPFIMLNIDGEGWKTDISMIDFIRDTKYSTIDIISKTMKKYVNAVLADLDEMGVEIPEKCTICSDSSKNYNVSDEFLNSFEETLQCYNPAYKELDYIIEVDNGCCVDAECTEAFVKMSDNNLSSENTEHIIIFGEYTLEDIYNLFSEEIQKAVIKMKEVKKLW